MLHEMKLQRNYFDLIKSGQKIYEIRLKDEKRRLISVGDVIFFKKEPNLAEQIKTEVKDLIYFDTFDEMLDTLPLDKIGFCGKTKEEVKDIYHNIYPRDKEIEYGIVAIKIRLLGI